MPVRSLGSSILRWPDAKTVDRAIRSWARKIVNQRRNVLGIGYFGSYARGDWGVGSDLDLVIVIESSTQPFERRAAEWDLTRFPVPVDLLVYTTEEWQSLREQRGFIRTVQEEIVWVWEGTAGSRA